MWERLGYGSNTQFNVTARLSTNFRGKRVSYTLILIFKNEFQIANIQKRVLISRIWAIDILDSIETKWYWHIFSQKEQYLTVTHSFTCDSFIWIICTNLRKTTSCQIINRILSICLGKKIILVQNKTYLLQIDLACYCFVRFAWNYLKGSFWMRIVN